MRRLLVKRIKIDRKTDYIWCFDNINRADIIRFKQVLNSRDPFNKDIVLANHFVKPIPATQVKFTFRISGFKSRAHLMRQISKAIGKDWQNISYLEVLPNGSINVTKMIGV